MCACMISVFVRVCACVSPTVHFCIRYYLKVHCQKMKEKSLCREIGLRLLASCAAWFDDTHFYVALRAMLIDSMIQLSQGII